MRVAVIGASGNRQKFGNIAVRSYVANGHEVIPVNPTEPEIEGLTAYPSILEVPGHVDRVLMYVPPKIGITVLEDIAQKGVGEVYLNPGTADAALLVRAAELRLTTVQECAIIAINDSPSRYR